MSARAKARLRRFGRRYRRLLTRLAVGAGVSLAVFLSWRLLAVDFPEYQRMLAMEQQGNEAVLDLDARKLELRRLRETLDRDAFEAARRLLFRDDGEIAAFVADLDASLRKAGFEVRTHLGGWRPSPEASRRYGMRIRVAGLDVTARNPVVRKGSYRSLMKVFGALPERGRRAWLDEIQVTGSGADLAEVRMHFSLWRSVDDE
ncbi:MAG: hypothetical protein R8K47_04155 [Mariprofundaceae bacterium]